ncbi:MAG: trimeric intracellular cation channel family protein [Thioalkalivibrionaceae bacterium]
MDVMWTWDFAGVALFAATGALVAARLRLDIIGFLFFAAVTGIGGGTVRDVVLDAPVFWVVDARYIVVCVVTAVVVYLTAHRLEARRQWMLWLDALALAAYGVFGAYKGLMVTESPVVAVVMGVLTSTFGGILRDVLAGTPSVLLQQDVYVSAALAGALTFVAMVSLGVVTPWAAALGFAVALGLRGGAIAFGWRLPVRRAGR